MPAHIVVFNHSPEILERFQDFLERQGFTVRIFLQELGELPNLSSFTPDLIILGHIRGYPSNYPEFIHELRTNPSTQELPILVCTTGELVPVNEDDYGRVQYVPVSVDVPELERIVVSIRVALNLDNGSDS